MVIILFRSKLTAAAGADYEAMNSELEEYVKTMAGFLDVKGFTAADGERLTVVWWKDKETLRLWEKDSRHMDAKRSGRRFWYQYYKMEVAEVFRESNFGGSEVERSGNL